MNIFARAFYALGDTATPMRVSVFCLAVNLLLSLLFITHLRQAGLGLANTITSCLNAWLLLRALRKKLGTLELAEVRRSVVPLLAATLLAGVLAWAAQHSWNQHLGHATFALRLGEVFVPASVAALGYALLLGGMKLPAAVEVSALLRKKLLRPRP